MSSTAVVTGCVQFFLPDSQDEDPVTEDDSQQECTTENVRGGTDSASPGPLAPVSDCSGITDHQVGFFPPPELWRHILSFLGLRDRLRCRLVSKALEQVVSSLPYTEDSLSINRPIEDCGLAYILRAVGLKPSPPHCTRLSIGDWTCSCCGEEFMPSCPCYGLTAIGLNDALRKSHRLLTTLELSALQCVNDSVVKEALLLFTTLNRLSFSGCVAVRSMGSFAHSKLVELDVSFCTAMSFGDLQPGCLPQLEDVDATGTNAATQDIDMLVKSCPKMKRVFIGLTPCELSLEDTPTLDIATMHHHVQFVF